MKGNCVICGKDLATISSIKLAEVTDSGVEYRDICVDCAKNVIGDDTQDLQVAGGTIRGLFDMPPMRIPVSQPNSEETGKGYGHE